MAAGQDNNVNQPISGTRSAAATMRAENVPRSVIETSEFYDVQHIVDPRSPQAEAFAQQMTELARRLLGNRYNANRHQFRFLLADNPSMNAFTIPALQPTPIVFNKGLLENVATLDELAGVMSHEMGHILARQELGDAIGGSSKAEELAADTYAVKLLSEAGFNPKALEDLLTRMEAGKNNSSQAIFSQTMTGVHPLSENRASTMQTVRIALNRDGFASNAENTPVPSHLRALMPQMNFASTTDMLARMRNANYEEKSSLEKIDWIVEQARSLAQRQHTPYADEGRDYYAQQLADIYKNSTFDISQPGVSEALHGAYEAMTDAKLNLPHIHGPLYSFGELYKSTLKHLGLPADEPPYEPIGRFREAARSVNDFIHARSIADAIEAAVRLKAVRFEASGSFHDLKSVNLGEMTLPGKKELHEATKNGPVDLPFIRHEGWINQLSRSSNDRSIEKAALQTALESVVDYARITYGNARMNADSSPFRSFKHFRHELIVNDGAVTGVYSDPVIAPSFNALSDDNMQAYWARGRNLETEEYLAQERINIEARTVWERQLLGDGVPWDLLKTDPNRFIHIYKEAIDQPATTVAWEHPFATQLVEYAESQFRLRTAAIGSTEPMAALTSYLINDTTEMRHSQQYNLDYIDGDIPLGLDVDHPYMRLYRGDPMAARTQHYGQLLSLLRVDPFAASDTRPLPRDMITRNPHRRNGATGLSDAYFIDDARMAAKNSYDDASLTSLLEIHQKLHYLEQAYKPSPAQRIENTALRKGILAHINTAYGVLAQGDFNHALDAFYEADNARLMINTPQLKEQWVGMLIDRMGQLSIDDRASAMRTLLQPRNVRFGYNDTKFNLPTLQQENTVATLIADDMVHVLGRDDGSSAYLEKALATLEGYTRNTHGNLRSTIIANFADESLAQSNLAYELRDIHHRGAAIEVTNNRALAGISETGLEAIKQDPLKRAALLEYLSRPLSSESVATFHDAYNDILRNSTRVSSDDVKLLSLETQHHMIRQIHTDFWNAPLVARTVVANNVLFPPQASAEAVAHATQSILERVVGGEHGQRPFTEGHLVPLAERIAPINAKILESAQYDPDNDQRRQDLKGKILQMQAEDAAMRPTNRNTGLRQFFPPTPTNEETVRLIVSSYLDAVGDSDPAESRLLISALLSAEHARVPGQQMRLGQTLHLVLSQMGPAGAKLLQAIHSNPATPADIRADLESSKISHDTPTRWDAISILEDTGLLTTDGPNRVTRIGPVIGSGSFGITMRNQTVTGEFADTLLRPRALAKATREFHFMLSAARAIANRDPRMLPVLDMIAQGEHSSGVETRMSLAAKQDTMATQSYDGVTVTVPTETGSEVFTHRMAQMQSFGPEYKRANLAPGLHFLKLPGTDTHYRSASAQAIVAAQLAIRFAGMPVDRDRHGGNLKIDGNTIHHFDFGMQEVLPPTDAQKSALGKVVGQAVKDTHSKGGNFSSHLVQRIDALQANQSVGHFLAGFKREILSLGDYMNALSHDGNEAETTAKLTGILGHALYGPSTDPIIQRAFNAQLGVMSSQAEATLRQAAIDSGIRIAHVRTPDTLQIPDLTPDELRLLKAPQPALPNHLATRRLAVQSGVNNGFGVAMGGYALYDKFASNESFYHQDMRSGDVGRIAAAHTSVGLDVAMIATSGIATGADASVAHNARTNSGRLPTLPPAAPEAGRTSAGNTAKAVVESVDEVADVAKASGNAARTAAASTASHAARSVATSSASVAAAAGAAGSSVAAGTAAAGATGGSLAASTTAGAATASSAGSSATGGLAAASSQASGRTAALHMAGRISTKAMIPLAMAAGGVQTIAATRAGDRERAAGAIGGTMGGILTGMAAGAAAGALMGGTAGSVVPGIGTIAVGVVAGVAGGIGGAIVGDVAARRYASSAVGWLTGVDGKFKQAMQGLDPRLTAFIDQNRDNKRDVEDIHKILKRAGLDSIDRIDQNKDRKLSSGELNSALAGVIINKELGEKITELNARNWGKVLGNKDGRLTMDELKAALPKGIDLLGLDKNRNGDISGREITDALVQARPPARPTTAARPVAPAVRQ